MVASYFKQLQFWKTLITPRRYSYDLIPSLTGQVAIVTGANTGLGYATMVALAERGAHVFAACRSKQRATDAIERATKEIKDKNPDAEPKMEFLELDLNDMKKCRQAANTFLEKNLPIHMLILNSGIMMVPFALSADGIETQFAVNHMG
jgi:NAD(P)-dependent dehydrogenase (short-subunit alcohol dehydrogenase family)